MTTPKNLRTRVVSYTLGTCKVFIESVVVETSKQAHSIVNMNYCLCYQSKVIEG